MIKVMTESGQVTEYPEEFSFNASGESLIIYDSRVPEGSKRMMSVYAPGRWVACHREYWESHYTSE